jgi:cell wall-associated NlpC family hydrolase
MRLPGGLVLANKAAGKHRADVEINVLESFEFRSRASVREAEKSRQSRLDSKIAKKLAKRDLAYFASSAAASPRTRPDFVVTATKTLPFYSRRPVRNFITMSIATGIFATFALPAYAYNPDIAAMSRFTTTDAQALAAADGTQNLTVAAVNTVKFARGAYKSADADEIARQETLNSYRTYSGPTAEDYLANPPYSTLDGGTILKVAAKFVGTPYVFGGSTPRGFDCSGYVAFVFAQFGVALPHSVHGQARLGILIKPQDALPGDLVVFNDFSHDGIYAGNGNFYHAPRRGDNVKLAPIFTSNIHFVRLATN